MSCLAPPVGVRRSAWRAALDGVRSWLRHDVLQPRYDDAAVADGRVRRMTDERGHRVGSALIMVPFSCACRFGLSLHERRFCRPANLVLPAAAALVSRRASSAVLICIQTAPARTSWANSGGECEAELRTKWSPAQPERARDAREPCRPAKKPAMHAAKVYVSVLPGFLISLSTPRYSAP